jgi:hypothetical protein
VIVATSFFGNMSATVGYRLADQGRVGVGGEADEDRDRAQGDPSLAAAAVRSLEHIFGMGGAIEAPPDPRAE